MNKGFKGALIASAVASMFTMGPAFAGKTTKDAQHSQAKAQASCSGKSGCGAAHAKKDKNGCSGSNGCGATKKEAKSMKKADETAKK